MKQFSINIPKLKEIEQMVWRIAQDICVKLTENILEELDQYIAEHRDTGRYKLKEKRPLGINLLFGYVGGETQLLLRPYSVSQTCDEETAWYDKRGDQTA
ncbi:hypothetical protein J2S00_003838 [Caldalkalibacillus uzonensis]|uniref:Transposase n=1 Tax=Caldalkalibacillus uzonensis TaxID=353224 RepID=A0ABU0CXX3_9BACI|nr:UPF0236 family protein [Caldalkalibacillus uzonensis]MDQ0340998.1 hypothetical protein [Caldalkalibacillus uzonensis]